MSGRAVRIPRGTCMLFGAIKALGGVRNSAILVHGPKGCVYHINYILGMRGDRPSTIYSTCLDESDVIFGAEQKLRDAIGELLSKEPEVLFVLSCCASGIIGEDVEGVVADMQAGGRIIGIDSGGFEGDFRTGYRRTLKRLVEEIARPPSRVDPRSVNLIGLLRSGPDIHELERVLDLVGVRVHTVLTADTDLREIEEMGTVALNIVLCEAAGSEAAEALHRRFGTPFLQESLPIGIEATLRFLDRVAGVLGIEDRPATLLGHGYPDAKELSERRIALIGGPTRALSMTRFFRELGTEPRLIVLDFDNDARERLVPLVSPACEVLVEPEQDVIIEKLREKEIDLVIGGMLERPLAALLRIDHVDIMHGSTSTVGFRGAENLLRLFAGRRVQKR